MQENQGISRRTFMAAAAAAGLAASARNVRAAGADTARPNIVLLLTDDQRWDALGCMGNGIIHTPHLDQLCAEGTRFDNAFVSTAICCSSRAGILTGLHTRCHGVEDFATPVVGEAWAAAYPALLRDAGYFTGFAGKFGVGSAVPSDAFDFFEGFAGQGRYFLDPDTEQDHLTKHIGNAALQFLDACPPDRPFCLSVSFKAPHVQDDDPRQFLYDPALEHLYQDVEIPPPAKAEPERFEALPEFIRNSEGRARWQRRFATPEMYQQMVKGYYRLVSGVDREVGRIRAALAERGLDRNTVIVFTSDNGFFLGEYGLAGKWLQYEESIRVPLVVHDPRIPADGRAAVRAGMAMNIDLAPTLLGLAGAAVPPSMQGRSLVPLLETGARPWREECFFEHHFANDPDGRVFIPGSDAVRTDRWKYVCYDHGVPAYEELFDLRDDPGETRNLAGDAGHADTLNGFRERLLAWTGALAAWDRASTWQDPA